MMELEHILKNFLDGSGKLTAFPAKRKMKVYCLFYLAGKFEAEREYTEREISWTGIPLLTRQRCGGSCMITASWIAVRTGGAIGWVRINQP